MSYDSSSANLANSLKNQYNKQVIIILSLLNEKDQFYSTINMDMEGYLSILSPPDEIIEDIKAISTGEKRVSRKLMSSLISTLKRDLKSPDFNPNNLNITSRELDILNLMAKGKTNKEIGRELNISPNTVKYLISHLFVKFSATSRADVVYKGYSILKKNKANNM
jgi:DNA-binding NarL/FixJ family response regulator